MMVLAPSRFVLNFGLVPRDCWVQLSPRAATMLSAMPCTPVARPTRQVHTQLTARARPNARQNVLQSDTATTAGYRRLSPQHWSP
jgi:hypothetical protein